MSVPDDPSEREADHVADRVLQAADAGPIRTAPPALQRKCASCQEEERQTIQAKSGTGFTDGASLQTSTALRAAESPGSSLSPEVRGFFEPRFNHDFSKVRVHADGKAAAAAQGIGARAYTTGSHIVFGAGEFAPHSREGRRLLAHELTHVIQQNGQAGHIHRKSKSDAAASGDAAEADARELLGLPKDGVYLKTTPENKPDNNFNAALVENGDKVVVKNGNVLKFRNVKNGTWAWIDVPGKTSPQKDYPVMHGFIETKYLSEAPKGSSAKGSPRQPAGKKNNPDLSSLTDVQLESEVDSMREHLKDHSDAEMSKKLALYEAEAARRVDEERKLSEMPDAQLESEVDATRDYLREHSDVDKAKKLATYEAEAARRVEKERKAAEAKKAKDAEPQEDILELESALRTLKGGRYVSPIDQGASGASAESGADRAKSALRSVNEKFLVPATDEMALNPALRLEASITSLEARIEKQKQFVANWSTDTKIKKAVESAIGQLGGELGERLKELLSPESLAIMSAFIGAYVFSQVTPAGWLADIVVAGLIAATIIMLKNEAVDVVKLLIKFVDKAEGAKTQEDIDEAGQALAAAVTKVGVDIIVAILLHKAGKAANLKPPTPRSPGLADALFPPEGTPKQVQRGPATSGIKVDAGGTAAIDPGPFNMSMMEGPPEGSVVPENSGGSGKGSGGLKGAAKPAKPPPGQDVSAGAGLPKDPFRGKKPPAPSDPTRPTTADEPAAKSRPADKPVGDKAAGDKAAGDKPADKSAGDKATDDASAEGKESGKGSAAKADPQQGVKDALERINKRIDAAKAELAEKGKEISRLDQEEWALRQKLKSTPETDPGRGQMLEDLKAKQKRLTELRERQEHRKALIEQDFETRTRLKNALEAKTYARPSFTEAERAKIWDRARIEGGGKVRSPSGVEIKPGDPWEVGHKPKYEFWKHVRSAAERGISREQFLRECKDLDKYRPETKDDNGSHAFEDKTDAYLGE